MSTEVFGVIAPHPPIMVEAVGGSRSAVTAASSQSMHEAAHMLQAADPDVVVIMSPHSPAIADAFVIDTAAHLSGSLAQFGAPQARFSYKGATAFARRLLERLDARGIPALDRASVPVLHSGELDHGVMVPMSFLDPDGRWPLVSLSLSYLPYQDHWAAGEEVAATAAELGRRIAFVASGDMSHRLTEDAPAGFSPRAHELDERMVQLIAAADFAGLMHIDPDLIEAGGECGLRSFITLGGAASPASAKVLSYEGPWGVGYLTAVVNEQTPPSGAKSGMPGQEEHRLVALAREAIEAYVSQGKTLEPSPLEDPELPPRAGVFVSLHRNHELRGCIGTIVPTEPTLAKEVVRNAIQASIADPRFPKLEPDELPDLDIKVDVLHTPTECGFDDLDPLRFGVIVSSEWKRGLLLPDLEGVKTPEDQFSIACRKAGIAPGESIQLHRFRVDRFT